MNNKELLQWYAQMGVDEAVDVDVHSEAPSTPQAQPTVREPIQATPIPREQAPTQILTPLSSRTLAESCSTLEELREAVLSFDGCELKKTATNTVFADGNPDTDIMLIGEAPGATEDMKGIPFCGESGQLLDKMIQAIGLDRTTTYISNTLFWRPPGNRRPTPQELEICAPFVERHIQLISPKLLILVGGTAVTSLLKSTMSISKLRRKTFEYSNQYLDNPIMATAIFHPSYLLRQPSQKRTSWHDLLYIQHLLKKEEIHPFTAK